MGLPDLVKICDLFVYLIVQFRSFQFEEEEEQEVPSTFVANIHHFPPFHQGNPRVRSQQPNLDNLLDAN